MVHCSKMQFTKDENENGQGWCATKKSSRGEKTPQDYICKKNIFACPGKIEGWGMCNKACSPQNQAFAFANMNLLTDDECRALTKWVGDKKGDIKNYLFYVAMCRLSIRNCNLFSFTQSNVKVHHFGHSGPLWDHWIPSRPFGQF